MNVLDLINVLIRLGTLLFSVYAGYILSLVLNSTRELAVYDLLPATGFGMILPVALISGFYGSCFALEFFFCVLLLVFNDYPLLFYLIPGCFSFFFQMIVFASWANAWEFHLPRWSVVMLPFFGIAVLAALSHWKRI